MSSKKYSWGAPVAFLSVLCLVVVGLIAGNAFAGTTSLIGSDNLDGRNSLQLVVKDHPTLSKTFAFIGHHRGTELNTHLTIPTVEHNGTTILDVTDPTNPIFIRHIPGASTAEGRAVQVAYNYMSTGRDYLIRNQEVLSGGPPTDWFEILDITATLSNGAYAVGSEPLWITNIAHKYPSKSRAGLDPLTAAHKGWWHVNNGSGESYYFGSAADTKEAKPGHQHMIIWDLSDIANPKYVSSGWIYGQKKSQPGAPEGDISLHSPTVDWDNNKVHGAFLFGGNVVVWDISDITNPKEIFNVDYNPPYPDPGPHTSLPFSLVDTPNFTPGLFDGERSNPRDYILVSDEGFGGDTGTAACQDVRNHLFTLDVTNFEHPVNVAAFKVPDDGYCEAKKSVRPHQFAETADGELYDPGDHENLVYVAYFSKGLRIIDYSDPYNPKEVGFFIPPINSTPPVTKNNSNGVQTILSNDVDINTDSTYGELAYVTDRAGTGLHIIKYTP